MQFSIYLRKFVNRPGVVFSQADTAGSVVQQLMPWDGELLSLRGLDRIVGVRIS